MMIAKMAINPMTVPESFLSSITSLATSNNLKQQKSINIWITGSTVSTITKNAILGFTGSSVSRASKSKLHQINIWTFYLPYLDITAEAVAMRSAVTFKNARILICSENRSKRSVALSFSPLTFGLPSKTPLLVLASFLAK